jgi:hypothetical protein
MSSSTTPACTSAAKYGETPEFVFKTTMRMGAGMNYAEKHISSMTTCYSTELATRKLSKNQSWQLKANYDYKKFAGNKGADGKQEGIMAIAIMYVVVPAGGVKLGGESAAGAAAPGSAAPAPASPKGHRGQRAGGTAGGL